MKVATVVFVQCPGCPATAPPHLPVLVSAQLTPTGHVLVVRPLLPSTLVVQYGREEWAAVHRRAMAAVVGAELGSLFNLSPQEPE